MKNSLMLQFLEVSEVGSQSIKKYEHPRLALRKIQGELLAMRDECDDNVEDFEKIRKMM